MKEFDKALSNLVREFANGGAIRHFVELEYSVKEIKASLDFPMSVDGIAELVWKEYIDTKVICADEESINAEYIIKTDFVKDYNKYGKTSLRKVTKKVPIEPRNYITCDFGKLIYKDKDAFCRRMNKLPDAEREMIENLPWPLSTVYVDSDTRLGEAVAKFYAE
ncbi:MAG: hypothetical protein K5644_09390 [Lachnospiraceae bacterium]|nr:hypothetical protein [Lachnospiraceae bacterium]